MTERPIALAALSLLAACGESDTLAEEPWTPGEPSVVEGSLFAVDADRQWRLPRRLSEISGLAVTPDGRLFGHDDETAALYEFDVEEGRLVKAFAVGDPVERGDFEGLAISPEGEFHLITSGGRLLSFREGEDGAAVGFTEADVGLRQVCEIEGLAYAASEDSLIVACKSAHARRMRDTLALYAWSDGGGAAAPWLQAPMESLGRRLGLERIRPSGVEIDPETGRLIIVSAVGGAMVELDRDGGLLAARWLDESHVQAEGVTVLPDGSLVIADEAARGRALLTRYPRVP